MLRRRPSWPSLRCRCRRRNSRPSPSARSHARCRQRQARTPPPGDAALRLEVERIPTLRAVDGNPATPSASRRQRTGWCFGPISGMTAPNQTRSMMAEYPGRRRRTWCKLPVSLCVVPTPRVAVNTSRAPLIPRGCPRAIAPPFGLICSPSSSRPRSRSTATPWAASVDLSDIDIELRQKLPRRRHRTNAHHAGSNSSRGDAHYPRPESASR